MLKDKLELYFPLKWPTRLILGIRDIDAGWVQIESDGYFKGSKS